MLVLLLIIMGGTSSVMLIMHGTYVCCFYASMMEIYDRKKTAKRIGG